MCDRSEREVESYGRSSHGRRPGLVAAAALWLALAAGQAHGGTFEGLMAKAETAGSVNVIVGLRVAAQPEGTIQALAVRTQRAAIARAQDDLLDRLSPFNVTSVKRFETIPFVAMEVDSAALESLRSDSVVASIEEDVRQHLTLAESVPLIGAPAAWSAGYTGSGQVVAILDSGVDKTHPFLAGKVVSEACYSTKSLAGFTGSVCPGGLAQSTDVGSGVPCSVKGCEHGTHVAGIAAGKSAAFSGVAPDAGIIAIQVSSSNLICLTSDCVVVYSSDVIRGMQRVQQLADSYKIAAVNLSLGGSGSGSPCDAAQSAYKAAIDNLRSLGIATVAASGNDGNPSGASSPACISTAISVGSTGDGSGSSKADVVSTFSNSASFLSLLAPGDWINSSIPGGTFRNMRGTSQAAPHVTGAWAVLKSKTPSASVSQVLQALANNGKSISDSRNQIAKPRIRVDAAVASLSSTACTYSIAPASQTVAQSGGGGTINVTADAGCAWTARSDVAWLTIASGGSGTGNGSVSFSAAANTSIERTGTLSIAGQLFVVSQAGVPLLSVDDGGFESFGGPTSTGGSSYAVNRLTPSSYPVTIDAVAIYFASGVGIGVGDALTILVGTSPGGGSGIDNTQFVTTPATVQALDQFNVFPIPGVAVSAGDFVVGASMARSSIPLAIDTTSSQVRSYFSSDGKTFKTLEDLARKGNYGIRAIPSQVVSCLTITGLSPTSTRSGSGEAITITGTQLNEATSLTFSYQVAAPLAGSATQITAALPDTAESGPIAVNTKAGCAAALTPFLTITPCASVAPSSQAFGDSAGAGTFTVTAAGGCRWTARSNANWLTIGSGATGSGNGSVAFSVAANTNYMARKGTLTIGGVTVTVLQAASGGNCATTSIVPGQIVNSFLRDADCPTTLSRGHPGETWSFNGASGQKVDAAVRVPRLYDFDPLVGLIGPAGAVVATGSGTSGKTDARIQTTLPSAGTYVVEVTSTQASSGDTGDYTLTLTSTMPGCSYVVSPTRRDSPVEGGAGSITVTSTAGCTWEAGTDASWISIDSGRSGSGSGTVTYSIPVNPSAVRTAVVGVAGTSVTINQVCAFCTTGSPAVYHDQLAAALLTSGKVLITGGVWGVTSGTAELYDPATGTFSTTGNLISNREEHTATLLPNGKVLVAGGWTNPGLITHSSAELYDPSTGTFATTGAMKQARLGHTATLLPSGKVLVTGGSVVNSSALATAELYDPSTGTFAPTGAMAQTRSGHRATLLADGKVLITGGGNLGSTSSAAEIYDPMTGLFSSVGSLGTARSRHTATLLPTGKVLIAGGSGSTNSAAAELYDPATRTFAPTGSLIAARTTHTATLLPTGKVLISGGRPSTYSGELTLAELYDPATGTFAAAGGFNVARYEHTAMLLRNGKVLIVGGSKGGAELYCPPDNGRRRTARH